MAQPFKYALALAFSSLVLGGCASNQSLQSGTASPNTRRLSLHRVLQKPKSFGRPLSATKVRLINTAAPQAVVSIARGLS